MQSACSVTYYLCFQQVNWIGPYCCAVWPSYVRLVANHMMTWSHGSFWIRNGRACRGSDGVSRAGHLYWKKSRAELGTTWSSQNAHPNNIHSPAVFHPKLCWIVSDEPFGWGFCQPRRSSRSTPSGDEVLTFPASDPGPDAERQREQLRAARGGSRAPRRSPKQRPNQLGGTSMDQRRGGGCWGPSVVTASAPVARRLVGAYRIRLAAKRSG